MSPSGVKISKAAAENPFRQPAACWRLSFSVPMEFMLAFEETLSETALSAASFEERDDPSRWQVVLVYESEAELEGIEERMAALAEACGIVTPEARIEAVPQQDWLAAVARDFPPMRIGRFFVHGKHVTQMPAGAVALRVEAGTAFGSGEHATTSGCLHAIDRLAKRRNFGRILDMGCGSAILAMAAARCWPKAQVLAIDIDPVSVKVARENIAINHLSARVKAYAKNGYASVEVVRGAPYDLILANILARPLVRFSQELAGNLQAGGVAVLSGLLSTQAAYVLAAHQRQGLRLAERIERQGWSTLVLEK